MLPFYHRECLGLASCHKLKYIGIADILFVFHSWMVLRNVSLTQRAYVQKLQISSHANKLL